MSENTDRAIPKPPPVDRLSLLWRRVNDHKMVQWGVAYVALAYGIQHGVTLTSEAFDWPHAVARISMLLLALGLPLVMTLAWYHGMRASRRISGPELTIISILLVMSSLLFFVFVQPSEEPAAGAPPAVQPAGIAAARSASLNPTSAISIAVLPFNNLSGDAAQEFFSDGMTEEITSALAKIPDLRVVGRTSAFQFKGEKKDLRAIGQALSATHLIEGSVRKDGNEVRITAQLIKTDDGTHVWTESYDRELTGIFAVQEDIATAIARALRMPLGLKPGESLVSNRTKNQASYEDYLRAKALLRRRDFRTVNEAVDLLEQSVARDSDFAPAWGLLGAAYELVPRFDPVRLSGAFEQARPIVEASLAKAEAAVQRAIKLDPKNSDAYGALADVQKARGKYLLWADLYLRAFALDPDNPDLLNTYSIALAELGYLKQALPIRERMRALEPLVPLFNSNFAAMLFVSGQTDAALTLYAATGSRRLPAEIYAAQGRYSEAADIVHSFRSDNAVLSAQFEAGVRLLRSAPAAAASPQTLPRLGTTGWVYRYVGASERVLEYHEGNNRIGYHGGMEIVSLWAPLYAPVRKTERFKNFAREAGFVEYWRARGWPELCRPMGADDFVCD